MSNWQLGPEHPDFGKPVVTLTGPHRPWRPGEQRPCARVGCGRLFTVSAFALDATYCSLACVDAARKGNNR